MDSVQVLLPQASHFHVEVSGGEKNGGAQGLRGGHNPWEMIDMLCAKIHFFFTFKTRQGYVLCIFLCIFIIKLTKCKNV